MDPRPGFQRKADVLLFLTMLGFFALVSFVMAGELVGICVSAAACATLLLVQAFYATEVTLWHVERFLAGRTRRETSAAAPAAPSPSPPPSEESPADDPACLRV